MAGAQGQSEGSAAGQRAARTKGSAGSLVRRPSGLGALGQRGSRTAHGQAPSGPASPTPCSRLVRTRNNATPCGLLAAGKDHMADPL